MRQFETSFFSSNNFRAAFALLLSVTLTFLFYFLLAAFIRTFWPCTGGTCPFRYWYLRCGRELLSDAYRVEMERQTTADGSRLVPALQPAALLDLQALDRGLLLQSDATCRCGQDLDFIITDFF